MNAAAAVAAAAAHTGERADVAGGGGAPGGRRLNGSAALLPLPHTDQHTTRPPLWPQTVPGSEPFEVPTTLKGRALRTQRHPRGLHNQQTAHGALRAAPHDSLRQPRHNEEECAVLWRHSGRWHVLAARQGRTRWRVSARPLPPPTAAAASQPAPRFHHFLPAFAHAVAEGVAAAAASACSTAA